MKSKYHRTCRDLVVMTLETAELILKVLFVLETSFFGFLVQFCIRNNSQNMLKDNFIFLGWIRHFLQKLAKNSHFLSLSVLETIFFDFLVQFCIRNNSQNMLNGNFIFLGWISHFFQKLTKNSHFRSFSCLRHFYFRFYGKVYVRKSMSR